jgi:hypothetical protein
MTKSDAFEWNSEEETFTFIRHCFDIQKAKELIRKKPREVNEMNISGVADLVGNPPTKDGPRTIHVGGIGIDWEKVLTEKVDTTMPIILAPFQDSYLPIDGWHRIAKAKLAGQENVPCVVLTKSELKAVKLR